MMKQGFLIGAAALFLAGCGSEAPAPVKKAKAKTLTAGEYEVSREVTMLSAADAYTPATSLKQGDKDVVKACVAADGTLDPAMFIEAGDTCTATNSYMRSGRLSIQYQCNRAGQGAIFPAADGNFTEDGFEAVVAVATTFAGHGDYKMTRMTKAKRIGDCPASNAAAG